MSLYHCRRAAVRWFLAVLLLPSVAAAGVKLPLTPIDSLRLPNGLQAVMVQDRSAPIVEVQVWYHVGSKDERPGMYGFAHLFEHLMFDGTKNLARGDFSNFVVRSGGEDNAFTTTDATVFWNSVPANQLPVVLWLEADRMHDLRITPSAFDKERNVVEEERRHRFENEPYGNLLAPLYAHAFSVSPYRHMPIGSETDLNRATLEDVLRFHEEYYSPSNATLVIVGDFDESQAAAWVKQDFGGLAPSPIPIPRDYPAEPQQTAERRVRLEENVTLPAFVEGYHIPADGTPDAYPLELIQEILSDGDSSWLQRDLVYEKQMALLVQCSANLSELPNLFVISAIANPEHALREVEAETDAVLARLKEGKFDSSSLARAKKEALRNYLVSRDSPHHVAQTLGYDTVILKDASLYDMEIDRLRRVTPAEIARVARRYLTASNRTVVEVYPSGKTTVELGRN
jgi:zinc protease